MVLGQITEFLECEENAKGDNGSVGDMFRPSPDLP
jgi:hypothetical protein